MRRLYPDLGFEFFRIIRLSERERAIKKYVPRYCQECELLGICRDEDNKWKCINGCMLVRTKKKQK